MSLLMDALRKAEEEKRKAELAANAPPEKIRKTGSKPDTKPEPLPVKESVKPSIPNISLSLEDIADEPVSLLTPQGVAQREIAAETPVPDTRSAGFKAPEPAFNRDFPLENPQGE